MKLISTLIFACLSTVSYALDWKEVGGGFVIGSKADGIVKTGTTIKHDPPAVTAWKPNATPGNMQALTALLSPARTAKATVTAQHNLSQVEATAETVADFHWISGFALNPNIQLEVKNVIGAEANDLIANKCATGEARNVGLIKRQIKNISGGTKIAHATFEVDAEYKSLNSGVPTQNDTKTLLCLDFGDNWLDLTWLATTKKFKLKYRTRNGAGTWNAVVESEHTSLTGQKVEAYYVVANNATVDSVVRFGSSNEPRNATNWSQTFLKISACTPATTGGVPARRESLKVTGDIKFDGVVEEQ